MMRRDSLDEQIKQKITSIIEDVNSNGLRWKSEHKRLYHLLKRKKRGHIPDDFTIEDYERYIHNIINGIENEIYLYSIYEEDYFVFGDKRSKWVVFISKSHIIDTAFLVDKTSYENYVSKEDGYIFLGTLKEVLK